MIGKLDSSGGVGLCGRAHFLQCPHPARVSLILHSRRRKEAYKERRTCHISSAPRREEREGHSLYQGQVLAHDLRLEAALSQVDDIGRERGV